MYGSWSCSFFFEYIRLFLQYLQETEQEVLCGFSEYDHPVLRQQNNIQKKKKAEWKFTVAANK